MSELRKIGGQHGLVSGYNRFRGLFEEVFEGDPNDLSTDLGKAVYALDKLFAIERFNDGKNAEERLGIWEALRRDVLDLQRRVDALDGGAAPAPTPPLWTPTPPPPAPEVSVFDRFGGFLGDHAIDRYTAANYGYLVDAGLGAVYPKIAHGTGTEYPISAQWVRDWQALGVKVVGWAWLEGEPEVNAAIIARIVRDLRLDGFIANAEAPYEGAGYGLSTRFVSAFRAVRPDTPLGLSHVGYGYPYRDLDFASWRNAGAYFLPQCYDAHEAQPIGMAAIGPHDRLGTPRELVKPTVVTSAYSSLPDPNRIVEELRAYQTRGFSVWLLDSTPDDPLRTLGASGAYA